MDQAWYSLEGRLDLVQTGDGTVESLRQQVEAQAAMIAELQATYEPQEGNPERQ